MKLNPFPCHEYFPHHQEDAGGYRSCLHPRCQCNSVSTRRKLMSDQYLKRSAGHNNGQRRGVNMGGLRCMHTFNLLSR